MKPIFTATFNTHEQASIFKGAYLKDLENDYHVIVAGSHAVEKPEYNLFSVKRVSQHKINARKYGRI